MQQPEQVNAQFGQAVPNQGQVQFGAQIAQGQAALQQVPAPVQRVIDIPMKQGEVLSQYQQRKQVYKNAMKDLNDHDKAYCYANVYANITFLFAKYPQSLTEKVMKYAPQI